MSSYLLPIIWSAIIAFCILMYVILDGFTLGVGMLMPWMSRPQRDIAMSVILPTWDGNQTWLVLGVASLYGAFPLAFSIILPILYLPLLAMVIALLFRGVVFEFRLKSSKKEQRIWDRYFIISSYITTLIQGLILGTFIEGINPNNTLPWLSFYASFTAVALVFGYLLLGATRMILKLTGAIQNQMRSLAIKLTWIIAALLILVSVWTPFVNHNIFLHWFYSEQSFYLFSIPMVTAIAWISLLFSLKYAKEILPYWLSVFIFIGCYTGFAIDIWPYIVPHYISIWQAAAAISSLQFMLYGAVIMLPILLAYTGYAYKIFSGKVIHAIHY